MIKKIAILLLPFFLISCDGFGSKKVKNIVELTPQLSAESNESIEINDSHIIHGSFDYDISKAESYIITKNKIVSEPIFINDIIYTIDDKGTVSAFSRKSKDTLWTYKIANKVGSSNYTSGGILYNNGKLYITNGSRFLFVLDSDKGYELVRKEFPDIIKIKPVMLANNVILLQTVSNHLFAFDMNKSKFIWQHEGIFETLSFAYHVSPVVYNNQVIVSYSSGQVFSLDAKTGHEQWVLNLFEQAIGLPSFEPSTVVCAPIIDGTNMYIAGSFDKLLKINIATGSTIWQVSANDVQSMGLFGNSLFITNNARQIAAISTNNGKIKFVSNLKKSLDLKKIKATSFASPFITKSNDAILLHIIAKNGEIYNFHLDNNGIFLQEPIITQTSKEIGYAGVIPSGEIYLTIGNKIVFVRKKL